jgi:hypothetical protein
VDEIVFNREIYYLPLATKHNHFKKTSFTEAIKADLPGFIKIGTYARADQIARIRTHVARKKASPGP